MFEHLYWCKPNSAATYMLLLQAEKCSDISVCKPKIAATYLLDAYTNHSQCIPVHIWELDVKNDLASCAF